MITLLGSLLGFISSAFPDLLKIWRDAADRKHELAILHMQMEQQRQGHTQRLEEIQVQADVAESKALYAHASQPSGVKWVEALRASVRPVITYAFLFCSPLSKPLLYSNCWIRVSESPTDLSQSGMLRHKHCLQLLCPSGSVSAPWLSSV